MEIKKVKNGWEYDGLVFTDRSEAEEVKKKSEIDFIESDLVIESPRVAYDKNKPTSFGLFVSEYIFKKGGTTTSLAGSLEVSKQVLYKWINGDSIPTKENTLQILKFMKCSKRELSKAFKTYYIKNTARILDTNEDKVEKDISECWYESYQNKNLP